jgi:hypothetical protein
VFCNEEKLNVTELLERSRRFFLHDVEVDGELSSTSAWTPKKHSFQRWAGRIIQELCSTARLTQKMFTYFTCTNILKSSEPSTAVILKHALKRARIESFHWDIKNVLGFEDYRFRESDAAIIHSHLVLLAYSLLLILNKRIERHDSEQKQHSIGEACRRIRDRCLIAVCRWFQDRTLEGLTIRNILGMISPQIRIYK